MEDAKELLKTFANKQGWDENSQLGILLDFINEQMIDNKLRDFLQRIADEENEEPECSMCGDPFCQLRQAPSSL